MGNGDLGGIVTLGSLVELDAIDADGVECPYELYVRFEYPRDLFDDTDQDWLGREFELYSWITVVGFVECESALGALFEYESA